MRSPEILKKLLVAALLLCAMAAQLFAQAPDYHVQLLDENSGIQTASINTLSRDANGFLWVLSNRMVQRYDGQNAKQIEVKGEELLDLAIDSSGRVWVSSQSGIRKYINDHRGFELAKINGPAGTRFNKLQVSSGNTVWAMSNHGLYLFNERSQAFEPFTIKGLDNKSFDRRLLFGYGAKLFFTDGPSVYCWNIGTQKLQQFAIPDVRNMTALSNDVIWLATWSLQSLELDMRTGTVTPIKGSQFSPAINSPFILVKNAFPISRNEWFVSLNHGCYRYNIVERSFRKCDLFYKGVKLRDDEQAFPNFLDHEQNFWMILEEGIVFFKPRLHTIGWLRSPGGKESNWNNDVRAITEDNHENLWLATLNGFTRLNMNTGESESFRPLSSSEGYSFPSVRGLVFDGRNLIVGPTSGGVLIFDPVSKQFRKPMITGPGNRDSIRKQLEREFISGIYTRKNGEHIVLARNETYLLTKDYKIRPLDFDGSNNNTQVAAEDAQGNTWFGSYDGIVCTDDSLRTIFRDSSWQPSRLITALFKKDDSTMLAGGVGLYALHYANGKVSRVPFIPELANQRITVLFRDKFGKLWIGADKGLYRFTESTRKLEWFDVADNVQNKRFNTNAIHLSTNGYVFIGGYNGLNYFIPERITSRAEQLNVLISGIRVNQDDSTYVNAQLPVILDHGQQSLEFQFTTPYFHNPQKLQYRYRMQGLDSGWVYNGHNNTVRFSSLYPGKYVFRVAASLDGVNWFEANRSYAFTIRGAIWQRWWFIGLVALALAGIAYLFSRNRHKKTQRREMQKMIDYFALSGYDHATVDDILWDIARNCMSRLDFEDCVIYMVDEERKVLVQKAAYGLKNPVEREIFNPIEIPLGKGIVGSTAASGKPALVGDTSKDSRYIVDDARRFSELAVPITYGDKVLGVIDSEHHRKNFFNNQHLDVLTSVASICSAKIARVLAQEAALEKEKRMKELNHLMKESRLAALQSQMNPHFIFNAMNSIQRFTLQNDVENANRYISRFSRLLRMVLQHSEKNSITLEDELQMLQLYLEIESLRMNDAFSYSVEVDESIEADAVKIPGMMVQPFVENALGHGLAGKNGDKKLTVKFDMPEDRLVVCEVTDNGIGRDMARQIMTKKEAMLPHQSKGIALVKERLSLYNRQVNGKITIIDLKNDRGQAEGTQVKIEIPVM